MKQIVTEEYKKLEQADSVLIVGGGSTGVETAGYVKNKFPSKKVSICQRGGQLLS